MLLAAAAVAVAVLPVGAGSAQSPAPPAASAAPGGSPGPGASPAGSPAAPGWTAFAAKATPFIDAAFDAINAIRDALFSGTAGAVTDTVHAATITTADLLVWLDSNPPEACYQDAWDGLARSAELLAALYAAIATDGVAGAMDGIIGAGSALEGAAQAVRAAGAACGRSPSASPAA
jgi:hypothetical protein